MGQEQSAPAARRAPNKLSKPRTNSSTANLLSSKSAVQLGHRISESNNAALLSNRYSAMPVDDPAADGAYTEKPKDELKQQQKRRSIFRPKVSQDKVNQLALDTGVEREFVKPSPVDKPVPRWSRQERSRSNSIEPPAEPLDYGQSAET